MTPGLQLALGAGALVAFGLVLVVVWSLPAEPDLQGVLERLTSPPTIASDGGALLSGKERLGAWAIRRLPASLWVRTPVKELALLRIPLTRFYGEKLTWAALGLVGPSLISVFFAVIGVGLPLPIPAAACLGLAVLGFFVPNYNAIDDAKAARLEFDAGLATFIELVALERNSGAGTRQAMEVAAGIGDSWVFTRLSEELARSRWSGVPPWEALRTLAEELGLPELEDLAYTIRLSGEEGASIYAILRAQAGALRSRMGNDEIAAANVVGERMTIPASLLGVVFLAILVTPLLLRMTHHT